MVLVSVSSTEDGNGYDWNNDFAEALVVEPNASISLVNVLFERDGDYVVGVEDNAFQVRMGASDNEIETVAVPPGTYTAWTLASAIQSALNIKGASRGHAFNVTYDSKKKQFNISTLFHQGKAPTIPPGWYSGNNNPTGADVGPNVSYDATTNIWDFSKGGDGTNPDGVSTFQTNWAITKGYLETTNVPSHSDGGSRFQCELRGVLPTPTGNLSRAIVIGLWSNTLTPVPVAGASNISTSAIYNGLDVAIILKHTVAPLKQELIIVEDGQDIGFTNPDGTPYTHEHKLGDTYSILAQEGRQHLDYYYKRLNSPTWVKLPVGTGGFRGTQLLTLQALQSRNCRGILGANNGLFSGFKEIVMTPAGSRSLTGQDLEETLIHDHDLELDDHTTHTYTLSRNVNDADLKNSGYATQVLQQGEYSSFTFKVDAGQTGKYYASILDETKRLANATANGTDGFSDVVNERAREELVNGGGADNPRAVGFFNPSVLTLEFDCDANTIKVRREMNTQFNSANLSDILENVTLPAVVGNWNTFGAGSQFELRTIGHMGLIQLHVNPDKKDAQNHEIGNVLVDTFTIPRVGVSGAGTLALTNVGAGYTINSTFPFSVTGGTGTGFKGTIKSDGAGALTLTDFAIGYNGSGYTQADVLTIVIAGESPGTAGQLTVNALYTSDKTDGMGTSEGGSRTGYRYHLLCKDFSALAKQPTISHLSLSRVNQTTEGEEKVPENYVEFHPRYEPNFGDLIGFKGDIYYMSGEVDGHSNVLISDATPVPDANSQHHPIVHLNVNNLPLRSIIGQKFNKNSTLASGPVGSRNGVSRLLAQFPRYHEANGESSVDKFGPFYYNYFPYNIPLHNATHINLNELDITLTNSDGTLATDISDCKILLNITKEENVGGFSKESIGLPKVRPQTEEQRDVLKSQMIPLKG